MMVVVITGGYKMCKVPVKFSPPTNHHPVFYMPDALPVAEPTKEQCQSSVRNISSLKSPNFVTASGRTLKKNRKKHFSIQLFTNV